nr:MAG TPA: tail assembly chaperone protein [Caudoviricetes sp.]
MKPFEFWNSTVREVYTYFNSRAIRRLDDFRDEINLQEAVTNKILAGDCMNEKTKILMIRDSFSELFEKEEEEQTLEEQRKLFKG